MSESTHFQENPAIDPTESASPGHPSRASPKRRSGPVSSLANRDFLWLWIGMFFFFNGMNMQIVAGGWLVYTLTDSPMALGLVSASWGLPMLLLSLHGGAVADRVCKRNLLLFTQLCISAITLAITLLVATRLIALWHLICSSALFGALFAVAMPTRQAFIVELVGKDHLLNAIALGSVATNICRIASPAIAGILMKFIGIPGVYWMILLSYLLASLTTVMISRGQPAGGESKAPVMADVLEGLRYVRENAVIFMLLVIAFVPVLVAMPYQMLMPVFAKSVFGAGEAALGLMMSAVGVGALVGSIVIVSLGKFRAKGALMIFSGLVFGLSLILFGASRSLPPAFGFLFLVGCGSSVYMTLNNTLLMSNTPKELTGRVMSIQMMTMALMPLGSLPAGALAESVGAPLTVAAGGGLLALFLVAMGLFQPRMRRLR